LRKKKKLETFIGKHEEEELSTSTWQQKAENVNRTMLLMYWMHTQGGGSSFTEEGMLRIYAPRRRPVGVLPKCMDYSNWICFACMSRYQMYVLLCHQLYIIMLDTAVNDIGKILISILQNILLNKIRQFTGGGRCS